MGEIEFKGELHTIPAGAALVLKVDRHMTAAQTDALVQHCRRVLGPDQRVLVVGPEVTPMALDRLPVVSMDKASGPDMTAITIVNNLPGHVNRVAVEHIARSLTDPNSRVSQALAASGEHSMAEKVQAVADWFKVPAPDSDALHVNIAASAGLYGNGALTVQDVMAGLDDVGGNGPGPTAPTPEDPMEAARALVKKHGGGSGG